jgi:hypothetical protein
MVHPDELVALLSATIAKRVRGDQTDHGWERCPSFRRKEAVYGNRLVIAVMCQSPHRG